MWLKPISNSNCFRQLKLPEMDVFNFIYSLTVQIAFNHSLYFLLKFTAFKTGCNECHPLPLALARGPGSM